MGSKLSLKHGVDFRKFRNRFRFFRGALQAATFVTLISFGETARAFEGAVINCPTDAPYSDQRGWFDVPCFDGRPQTLSPGQTGDLDGCPFSGAAVYTCMTGPHAFIGIVLSYACKDGTSKTTRVVSGKNMVGDHTNFQSRDLNTCTLNGSTTNAGDVENLAKNHEAIISNSQVTNVQVIDSFLAPLGGVPCWNGAVACRDALLPRPKFNTPMPSYPSHTKCFPAGSLVSTTVGEKAIEKLRKGDMVRAYDAPNGKNILSKIRTVGFYKDAAITRIQLSGLKDDVIETTEAHKIFVLKDGAIVSVPVSGLKVGDVLLRQSDVNASDLTDAALYAAQEGRLFAQKQSESLKLQQVSIKAITFKYRVADVFNIELEEGDSYFVNGVLVESLANYRDHILND